jgi:hypothetical protein
LRRLQIVSGSSSETRDISFGFDEAGAMCLMGDPVRGETVRHPAEVLEFGLPQHRRRIPQRHERPYRDHLVRLVRPAPVTLDVVFGFLEELLEEQRRQLHVLRLLLTH